MIFIPSVETIRRGATLLLSIFNFDNKIGELNKNDFNPLQASNIDRISPVNSVVNFYTNPVINSNLPDPSVTKLADRSGWILVATSEFANKSTTVKAFPTYFSKDLVNWTFKSHIFSEDNFPNWVKDRFYAPELHFVDGRYVLYYAAGKIDGKHGVGAAIAVSDDPFGKYKDIGKAMVENHKSVAGVIDPHYFRDPVSQKQYLLWKQDNPFSLQTSAIYIQELNNSGTKLKGRKVKIIINNLTDERFVAEAPWMMYRKGYYYLFYSSGWYSEPFYNVRIAKSKSPMGPFIKKKFPILETNWYSYKKDVNTTFVGPGHCSVVDVAGTWWMIYHTWLYGHVGTSPGRVVALDKVTWREGWPYVGTPSTDVKRGP